MHEKRLHERITLRVPVTYSVPGGESVDANAKDLSLGGMFLAADSKPAYGTELTVLMSFPGEAQPMALSATVRWVSEDGFGVQFGLLGARATHRITQLTRMHK